MLEYDRHRQTASSKIARAHASMLALSVGDALGQTITEELAGNGRLASLLRSEYGLRREGGMYPGPVWVTDIVSVLSPGPWCWTDDTAMASDIYHVLQLCGEIDQDRLAQRFFRTYMEQPYRGYGRNTVYILEMVGLGEDWRKCARASFAGKGSRGNGAAMRVAVIGAYYGADLGNAIEMARKSAEITHTHPEAIDGAVAVALAAAIFTQRGIDQKASEALKQRIPFPDQASPMAMLMAIALLLEEGAMQHKISEAVSITSGMDSQKITAKYMNHAISQLGNGSDSLAIDTVPLALWIACHCPQDFSQAMYWCVHAGGDRDTLCAITAGILGSDVCGIVPDLFLNSTEGI